MRILLLTLTSLLLLAFAGCDNTDDDSPVTTEHNLIFKFRFDSTQVRLNNLGQVATMPSGHAGQNPRFNGMSAHYLELAQGALTPLGSGAVLYHAPETTAGGDNAIDFSQSVIAGNNEQFLSIPLKNIAAGEYEYLRVSLAFQNFDVTLFLDTVVNVAGVGSFPIAQNIPCTVASFVGFNTYINSFKVKNQTLTVNDDRKQGFWAAEGSATFYGVPYNYLNSGQAPAGATTVVNPLAATSPIPAGSCVVTGAFSGGKLSITGKETSDIVVVVSLSTNKSFEWIDSNSNGKWEPSKGEQVVDMGLRGVIPMRQ